MIAVGSAVLLVSVVSTAARIASTRHGLHPSVLFPVVVIAAAVLCVPVGLEMGGAWAAAARWMSLGGGCASLLGVILLPAPIRGAHGGERCDTVAMKRRPYASAERLVELDDSIESALQSLARDRSSEAAQERW